MHVFCSKLSSLNLSLHDDIHGEDYDINYACPTQQNSQKRILVIRNLDHRHVRLWNLCNHHKWTLTAEWEWYRKTKLPPPYRGDAYDFGLSNEL